jgi:hypothetical protein
MGDEENDSAGDYCARCGNPIPPGLVICPKCSDKTLACKRVVGKPSEDSSESVSVLKTPEDRVMRGVVQGLLTREEGNLLLLLLSRGRLLDFSVRSVLTSLIGEIAEEGSVRKREDRAYVLREFVGSTMPNEDLVGRVSSTFQLR